MSALLTAVAGWFSKHAGQVTRPSPARRVRFFSV
jgi:hypothetical protein